MKKILIASTAIIAFTLSACASSVIPPVRTAEISDAKLPKTKPSDIRKIDDAVTFLELGNDVLRPRPEAAEPWPLIDVPAIELRQEAFITALQLAVDGHDIAIAAHTDRAVDRKVSVSNLGGSLESVVDRLCAIADLYCEYANNTITVKDRGLFLVDLPPLPEEAVKSIADGLKRVLDDGRTTSTTETEVVTDTATGTLIFEATNRSSKSALKFFDRQRSSTAMVIYETNFWEVSLDNGQSRGIQWEDLSGMIGRVGLNMISPADITLPGATGVGLQFSSDNLSVDAVVSFLNTQGNVQRISEPQIAVLSGGDAEFSVGGKQSYIAEISRTVDSETNSTDSISVNTEELETGLTIKLGSRWDKSTVFTNIELDLVDLVRLETVSVGDTQLQLPETTNRKVKTQVRIRPGDTLLLGGIVTERSDFEDQGPGAGDFTLFSNYRAQSRKNTELVFMLRPKVVVYGAPSERDLLMGGDAGAQTKSTEQTSAVSAQSVLDSLMEKSVKALGKPVDIETAPQVGRVAPPENTTDATSQNVDDGETADKEVSGEKATGTKSAASNGPR